jgi:hypothetical protein
MIRRISDNAEIGNLFMIGFFLREMIEPFCTKTIPLKELLPKRGAFISTIIQIPPL